MVELEHRRGQIKCSNAQRQHLKLGRVLKKDGVDPLIYDAAALSSGKWRAAIDQLQQVWQLRNAARD